MYQNPTTRKIATTIHKWANSRRRDRGGEPLSGRAGLNRAAERHSERMADAGEVGHHVGHGGPGTRTSSFRVVGENATKVYPVRGEPREVAAQALEGWMESDGHRANLLDPQASVDGVGVHIRGDSAFITHLFASGRTGSSRDGIRR